MFSNMPGKVCSFLVHPLRILSLTLLAGVMTFACPLTGNAGDLCKEGILNLKGDFETLQANGGLWTFMEKNSGLKDRSVLGLQIDGKIQLAIENIKDKCKDSGKKPSDDLYNKVLAQINQAKSISLRNANQTPPDKILAEIEALKKEVDSLVDGL